MLGFGNYAYYIQTRCPEAEVEMTGVLPKSLPKRLEHAVADSPLFELVNRNHDAVVYRRI